MPSQSVDKNYHVMCSCGQTYPIANPDLVDQISCGVCGKIIKIRPDNLIGPQETTTAIYRILKNNPPMERIIEGVRLIKVGKLETAKTLFQSVVYENKPFREAFYGLGYCLYRERKFVESFVYLGMAVYLGHPHAGALFEKVKQILNIDENNLNIPSKFE